MGQTLTNGVYLPDNGERNCYTGLSQNWQKLDNLLGNQGSNVSFSQTLTEGVEIGKITINGTEISMYHTDYSGKADASNVYTKTEIDTSLSSKANASDLTTHTSNADIHVTSTDKSNWNAKQDSLTDTQLNACNSGITSDKVSQYDGYASTKVNKAGDTMTGDLLGNGSNNLGTSSNKWKTINGINPGALSLPCDNFTDDYSNNLVFNDYHYGCVFTMLYDGWIVLTTVETNSTYPFLLRNTTKNIPVATREPLSGLIVPALKGDFIEVFCPISTSGKGVKLRLFKCQGNV